MSASMERSLYRLSRPSALLRPRSDGQGRAPEGLSLLWKSPFVSYRPHVLIRQACCLSMPGVVQHGVFHTNKTWPATSQSVYFCASGGGLPLPKAQTQIDAASARLFGWLAHMAARGNVSTCNNTRCQASTASVRCSTSRPVHG